MSVELDDMRALASAQREILIKLEWRWNEIRGGFCCPVCGENKPLHDDECELAAVLAFRVSDAVRVEATDGARTNEPAKRTITSAKMQLLHTIDQVIKSGRTLTLHEIMVDSRLCKQTVQCYFAALTGIGYAIKGTDNDWSTVSVTDIGRVALGRHERR